MADATNQSEPDFKLKPCITEILRTNYCQAGLTMLVDKVVLVTMTKTEFNRAYRLYLSDGEKSIQGMPCYWRQLAIEHVIANPSIC